MKAVIQRVSSGSVTVQGNLISKIAYGYVILLGIYEEDTEENIQTFAEKIVHLRIMADDSGKMNRSIKDANGEILLVSQFTLCADLTYGRRPSFVKAMKPDKAHDLYELAVKKIEEAGITVKKGKFGEYMDVEIQNDGPVTIVMEV